MAEIVKKERVPYRIWDKVNSKWNELMLKTNAKSVDADDGKTLQTKIGAVNGITSDLNGEASDVAASIKCVNQLNNSLGGLKFGKDGDGNYGYYGADGSLIPFSNLPMPIGESYKAGSNNTVLSTKLTITPTKNTIYVLLNSSYCNTPTLGISDNNVDVEELWSYTRQTTSYSSGVQSFAIQKYFKLTNVTPSLNLTLTFSGKATSYAANNYQIIAME